MTPADYRKARQERGTQKGVALALGVDYRTVQRREAGEIEVTREAALALLALPKTKRVPRRANAPDQRPGAKT